jgi:methyl-accepting chemotaxis protein
MAAANGIAEGDVQQSVTVSSKDELGATANAFGRMISYLEEMARTADEVADGNLTVQARPRSERDLLGKSFARLISRLGAAIGDVSAQADSVNSASQRMVATSEETGRATGEIAQAVTDVAQGAERQVRMIDEAKRSADEVAQAVADSAASARGTAEVAHHTRELAQEGVGAAEKATGAMQSVRDSSAAVTREAFLQIGSSVDDMATQIERIAAASQQIAASATNMQDNIAEIAAVAEPSSTSAEEVSASTEETSASTQEIAASAHQLSASAEQLNRLVAQFTVTGCHQIVGHPAGPPGPRRSASPGRSRAGAARRTIPQAVDQAQSGPNLIDRAHLVVDQAGGEPELADHVVGQVGRDPRSTLGPSEPQAARRIEGRGERGEPALELRPAGEEGHDHVERLPAEPPANAHPRRQLAERLIEPVRRADQAEPRVMLDPELAHQRRTRIPGWRRRG